VSVPSVILARTVNTVTRVSNPRLREQIAVADAGRERAVL
jgi:hypothetical protein